MTQPLAQPDPEWPDAEAAAEFWPVAWVALHDHEQLIAASQLLARSLAELAPGVEVGVVVQLGGGEPAATWVVVRAGGDPDGPALVESLLRSLLPWVGFDRSAAVWEIPRLIPAVGLTFTLDGDAGTPGPVPLRSRLLDVLGRSAGRWQLTVGTGLAVLGPGCEIGHPDPPLCLDTAVSLIGSGSEARLASSLLALDVSTPEGPVGVGARQVTGEALQELADYARAGVALPSGFLDPGRAGRLLSLPLRTAGDRPPPVPQPAPPEATARLFRDSVPPHILILGGTGQGKTTLLHHAAVDAARSGRSTLLVLSPHGDLVTRLAGSLYRESLDYRVVDFAADDPLRWNVTAPDPGVAPGEWATWLARIVKRLWPEMPVEFFGPVWERMSRIVLQVLVADPAGPHPITQMPAFFARESAVRDEALERIGDEDLTRSVEEELVPFLSARDAGNAAVWILSKIEGLVGNPAVARVVGSTVTEFDPDPTLQGIHTIVSAPVTRLGDDGSRLLGSVLIDTLWRRAQQTPPARPIEMIIDEWHKLATPAVGEILAEGRKFGLHLRLANQNASQVPSALWDTVLGNVGALITFRTGPRDAALLDPLFPTIRAATLTQLPPHWVAATTGVEDHVGLTAAPLPGDDDPGALRLGHERARRTAGVADRGVQLAFTYPAPPPAPAPDPTRGRVRLSIMDDLVASQRRGLLTVVESCEDDDDEDAEEEGPEGLLWGDPDADYREPPDEDEDGWWAEEEGGEEG